MSYILYAFKIFPIALLITSIVYTMLYMSVKGKRTKPPILKIILEYTLVGYFIMFIYVTQVMSFGNGMGARLNLSPLRPFLIAIKYGSNNAGMFSQFYLNVLMCMPLGLLLPIVFPKRFRNFLPVLTVSFGATFFTELNQLLTGRSADIDDIIANTLGGLLGFAVFILCHGIYYLVKLKKLSNPHRIKRYPFKVVMSVFLILFVASPSTIVKSLDSMQEFGYVYYGHMQPENIKISGNLGTKGSTATVYKTFVNGTDQEVIERLKRITCFKEEFIKEYDAWCCYEGTAKAAFVYDYNTWCVIYNYGETTSINKTKLPTEEKCIGYALNYAKQFEIDTSVLEFSKFNDSYGDDAIHVDFIEKSTAYDIKTWGNVSITIGEEGKLLSIEDNRTYHKAYKEVETISPKQAVKMSQEVGVGKINVTAAISSVTQHYYFQKEKGYLIPTWQINGSWHNADNSVYNWTPNIDAIK